MYRRFLSFSLFFLLILSFVSVFAVAVVSASSTHTIGFFEGTGGSIRISTVGVTYGAGTYVFNDGASLIIRAFASTGYDFVNFTFTGGSTTVNPIYTYAYSDFNITANFQAEGGTVSTYTVTLVESAGGVVAVNTMEGVESWVGVGQLEVFAGTSLPISVVTYYGYEFDSLLVKDVSGNIVTQYYYNPVNVTIDADYYISAVFSYQGATSTPEPNNTIIGGIMDSAFGQIFLVLMIIFVPPMLVLVGAPKVGYMGFFIVLLLMVLVGVQFSIIPPYFLFVMVVGFGLMFISAMKQVV